MPMYMKVVDRVASYNSCQWHWIDKGFIMTYSQKCGQRRRRCNEITADAVKHNTINERVGPIHSSATKSGKCENDLRPYACTALLQEVTHRHSDADVRDHCHAE